jgi:hypothetical protein
MGPAGRAAAASDDARDERQPIRPDRLGGELGKKIKKIEKKGTSCGVREPKPGL